MWTPIKYQSGAERDSHKDYIKTMSWEEERKSVFLKVCINFCRGQTYRNYLKLIFFEQRKFGISAIFDTLTYFLNGEDLGCGNQSIRQCDAGPKGYGPVGVPTVSECDLATLKIMLIG